MSAEVPRDTGERLAHLAWSLFNPLAAAILAGLASITHEAVFAWVAAADFCVFIGLAIAGLADSLDLKPSSCCELARAASITGDASRQRELMFRHYRFGHGDDPERKFPTADELKAMLEPGWPASLDWQGNPGAGGSTITVASRPSRKSRPK